MGQNHQKSGPLIVLCMLAFLLLLAACEDDEVEQRQVSCPGPSATTITNAGFEAGNLSGWVALDIATPFEPIRTEMGGVVIGCCAGTLTTAPTEGIWTMVAGFDGGGPGTIRLAQDVTVSTCTILEFDYWVTWNNGGTIDRTFTVNIEPAGGGAPLQSDLILTGAAGTVGDSGIVNRSVDLRGFRNQTVQIAFELFIPQSFTGPGAFQLDNIR